MAKQFVDVLVPVALDQTYSYGVPDNLELAPGDLVTVNGKLVDDPQATRLWRYHKPGGLVVSNHDPQGRPTVFAHVPPAPGLTYVGRLDYLTEGVLLFTTDGTMAHRLTHPSFEVERTYAAYVKGDARGAVRELREGFDLDDGPVAVRAVSASPGGVRGTARLEITLTEGRNREVRRICEALGLDVVRLVRERYGPIELGSLKSGESRPLTDRELRQLRAL